MTVYDDLILADSPILYLPLDDTSGTTATALVGSNGTYVNSPTLGVTGPTQVGSGVSFDGSSEYINMGNVYTTELTGVHSIEFWMKTSSTSTLRCFFGKRSGGTLTNLCLFGYRNSGAAAGWGNWYTGSANGTDALEFGGGNLNDDSWHHIVLVRDGTNQLAYVDGVLDNSRVEVTAPFSTTANLQIAKDPSDTRYYPGSLAAFAIYDYELTASQVASHFDILTPAESSHTLATDSPTLTQAHNLVSQSAEHSVVSDEVNFTNWPFSAGMIVRP